MNTASICVVRLSGYSAAMSALSPFMATVHVALGGAIGSVLRYQTGRFMTHWLGPQAVTTFPWATLTVNALGSLLMGVLAGWLARHGQGGDQFRLLLGVGLLGGFTTFSAFSLDALGLWQRGDFAPAAAYILASVLISLAAAAAGLAVAR